MFLRSRIQEYKHFLKNGKISVLFAVSLIGKRINSQKICRRYAILTNVSSNVVQKTANLLPA